MEESRNTIKAEGANTVGKEFDMASDALYGLCLHEASVSPLAFAGAVHSYIIANCRMLLKLAEYEEGPGSYGAYTYFDDYVDAINNQSYELRRRFEHEARLVASDFCIEADDKDTGGDECDF